VRFKIAVLPGDGVGPEVAAEGVKVLEAVAARCGHSFDLDYASIGGAGIDECGQALPAETLGPFPRRRWANAREAMRCSSARLAAPNGMTPQPRYVLRTGFSA